MNKKLLSMVAIIALVAASALGFYLLNKDKKDDVKDSEDSNYEYSEGTSIALKNLRDTERRAFLMDLTMELEIYYSEFAEYPEIELSESGFLLDEEQSTSVNDNFVDNEHLIPGDETSAESTKYCIVQEDGKYSIGVTLENGEKYFVGDMGLEEKCVLGLDSTSELNSDFNTDSMADTEKVGRHNVLSAAEISSKKSVITTDKGVIEVELFDYAPLAVSNHIGLANEGFYNGLTFHRREEGFVIQGGDPTGNGTGGPGYKFEDEFIPDTVFPRSETPYGEVITYEKGLVAMANAGPDTNGSQFFIMLDNVQLPPSYTIFGKVTSGIEAVEQIKVGDKMTKVEILNK